LDIWEHNWNKQPETKRENENASGEENNKNHADAENVARVIWLRSEPVATGRLKTGGELQCSGLRTTQRGENAGDRHTLDRRNFCVEDERGKPDSYGFIGVFSCGKEEESLHYARDVVVKDAFDLD
jgi:hypothetical protein